LAGDVAAMAQLSAAKDRGDYDVAYVYAGQAVGLVENARPAAEVIRHLGEGVEALLLERLAQLVSADAAQLPRTWASIAARAVGCLFG
jgi:NAD(P)H-dependent flavin oxidoreductase YrpB (nitropropane dioxygenase family)